MSSCRQCDHPLEKGIHTCGNDHHDPCVCPVCREAKTRNNPDMLIEELRTENVRFRRALEYIATFGDYKNLDFTQYFKIIASAALEAK